MVVSQEMEDRIKATVGHITTGKTVCPFARKSTFIPKVFTGEVVELGEALRTFLRERNNLPALLLVARSAMPTHASAKEWAFVAFSACWRMLMRWQGLTEAAICAEEPVFRAGLLDPAYPFRPLLTYAGKLIHCIGMGPQYRAEHPRYLPVTGLVLTWGPDVDAARATPMGAKAREQAFAAMGRSYDADELWMPEE